MDDSSIGKWVAGGISFLFVLIILFCSVGTVPAGFVGVRTQFSAVKGTVQPGLYVQVPFFQGTSLMDTQTQKEQVDATAASNDLQDVTATVAVNFHITPNDAGTIYQNIGSDYQARVIDPAIQESVKSITANYTAEQLITQREDVREKILALLSDKLQGYGVNVDALNIVNFAFSAAFNQAVEAKVTAQQNALTAENQVAQAQAQASSTIIAAQAQAKAIQIQTQALQSYGKDYVDLQAVQKWDGHLPTYIGGAGTVPFINVDGSGK